MDTASPACYYVSREDRILFMKKSIDAIDAAKLAGSILIFSMHCCALGEQGIAAEILDAASRWGVPFFFLCSAFFLFGRRGTGTEGKDSLRRYVRRIGLLYAVWFVYNLPNVVYNRLWGKDLSSAAVWLRFLKNSLLASTFTGSWYLTACLFGACAVCALSGRLKNGPVLGICAVPHLLCILTSVWHGVLPAGTASALRFAGFPLNLFGGCFYFALGKAIAENRSALTEKWNRKKAACGFLLCCALFALEILAAKKAGVFRTTDAAFSTAGMAFFLFLFLLQSERTVKNARVLRKMSTVIYCAQGNVLLVNGLCRKVLRLPSIVSFLVSAIIMMIICAAVLILQRKARWKWCRYLT